MLQYSPSVATARGLCLFVTSHHGPDLAWTPVDMIDALRSLDLACAFSWTGPKASVGRADDGPSVVDRQLRILDLLNFAEANVPDLALLICVDDDNRLCVEALLRGRPRLATRVLEILPMPSTASLQVLGVFLRLFPHLFQVRT